MLLKGRELPKNLERALTYIPPAAFAALVASSLIDPPAWSRLAADFVSGAATGALAHDLWSALIPLFAAGAVVAIALKTRSLLWCCLSGVACFGLLLLVPW
jgi:branched-subunit amino acid transport protein